MSWGFLILIVMHKSWFHFCWTREPAKKKLQYGLKVTGHPKMKMSLIYLHIMSFDVTTSKIFFLSITFESTNQIQDTGKKNMDTILIFWWTVPLNWIVKSGFESEHN